jgi:two-component system, LytTR family, response regulator
MSAESKIRAVIVDDEELARQVLRELIAAHPEIEIVAECANGFEAVKTLTEVQPDVLFLDIQMPKLDGFEVLELVNRDMAVIFTTAYDEYALKAFEVHAADYLLKPFGRERFEKALQHARERMSGTPRPITELAQSARPPGQYLDRIVVRDGSRIHIVPVSKLDYVEAQDDYVALASEGRKHLKQQTIASLESALDPKQFVRIHRSYIVNLERVSKLEPYGKDSKVAILTDGARLPVSRTGYERMRAVLEERPNTPP